MNETNVVCNLTEILQRYSYMIMIYYKVYLILEILFLCHFLPIVRMKSLSTLRKLSFSICTLL